jgi:Protein of unknown function (DUF3987)
MTKRIFPDWIEAFVQTFDAKTEAPTRLLFWAAVSTIAGAVTRRVHIDEVVFKYYPNFYIIFVAPPGIATKSSAINHGINILRQLDHIYLTADNTTYPAFIRDLANHYGELRASQAEEAEDDLWMRQCAATAAISEFGTFFKPEDEDMVNGLTDLWDCRNLVVKDTKYGGTDILEHPYVNIIAGTTTKWIKDKVKAQLGGWGLSSRIIFVYQGKKVKYVARPSKLWEPNEYETLSNKLLEDLKTISNLEGPMTFTTDADVLAEQWYIDHSLRMEAAAEAEADPWLMYFLSRKQAHIHKLAMVLSLARRSDLTITKQDFTDATGYVNEVELEVPWIFKHVPEPTTMALLERDGLERVTKLMNGSQISQLQAYGALSTIVDSTTANRIIENAVGRGQFKRLVDKGKTYLLP